MWMDASPLVPAPVLFRGDAYPLRIMRMWQEKKASIIVVAEARMTQRTKHMNNSRKQTGIVRKKKMGRSETMLNMIQENRGLMEYIEQVYEVDQVRMGVLQHIFLETGQMEAEEIRNEIYRYGSLIKGDDLLARQLFLWLLGMAENTRV